MTPATETAQPTYMVDNRANLIVDNGDSKMIFNPAAALELLRFLERTGYQAHANALVKGGAQ